MDDVVPRKRRRRATSVADGPAAEDTSIVCNAPTQEVATDGVYSVGPQPNLALFTPTQPSYPRYASPFADFEPPPLPPLPTAELTGQGETLDDLFGWLFANNDISVPAPDDMLNIGSSLDGVNPSLAQSSLPLAGQIDFRPGSEFWASTPIAPRAVQPQNTSPFAVPNQSTPAQWAPPGWKIPNGWIPPVSRVVIDADSRKEMFEMYDVRLPDEHR